MATETTTLDLEQLEHELQTRDILTTLLALTRTSSRLHAPGAGWRMERDALDAYEGSRNDGGTYGEALDHVRAAIRRAVR